MSKKVIIGLLLSVLIIGQLYFTSFASGLSTTDTFNVGYSQPYCSDYAGYLSVMYYENNDPTYWRLYTYFWNMVPNGSLNFSTNVFAQMDIEIDQGKIKFDSWCHSDSSYYLTFCAYDYNENLHVTDTVNVGSVNGFTRTETFSNCTIGGYIFGGNALLQAGTGLRDVHPPNIIWNSTAEAQQMNSYLYQILNSLNTVNSNVTSSTSQTIQWLEWLWNEVDNVENRLFEVQEYLKRIESEQKSSNTWLEKIFNFLEEKDEKEKEAATQQGNQSSKDVSDVIQDDSAGFSDSLGGLTSSMSYAGTECSWTFPTVKLPAISGVMDEVTLVDSKEIDFTYWVNSLPAGILLLVQSVCTAALIVFCFKELYGAISYVLTLKGGGNSE